MVKATLNIWQRLKAQGPLVALAPMDDVTDVVFRPLVHELAQADLYFTEFANADGWCSPGREAIERRLRLAEDEGPVIAQIWGLKPENYYAMARSLAERPFAGIDINMGCPAKDVLKKGACSGLIKNPSLAAEIVQATKEGAGGKLPVSVKTRIGYNEPIIEDWLGHLLEQDIAALTVHLRTVKEQSKVDAHWELMPQIVALRDQRAPEAILLGNGDVDHRQMAERLAEQTGCDGVMIGRGIFHDPWAFAPAPSEHFPAERLAALTRHLELWEAAWPDGAKRYEALKRFFKIYINGFEGAAHLRAQLMETHDLPAARAVLAEAF